MLSEKSKMPPTSESSFSTVRHPFVKKNIPGYSWWRVLSIALCFKWKNVVLSSDMGWWKTEFSKFHISWFGPQIRFKIVLNVLKSHTRSENWESRVAPFDPQSKTTSSDQFLAQSNNFENFGFYWIYSIGYSLWGFWAHKKKMLYRGGNRGLHGHQWANGYRLTLRCLWIESWENTHFWNIEWSWTHISH